MISIIITAYKEPATIGKAITQIFKNKIKEKFELIISAPDDETLDVARKYAKKDKRIRIIKDLGKGKPSALNMIFKKAKGEFLVLTDGDVYIDENSIKPLLEKLQDSKVGAVTGRPVPQESRTNKYAYWSHFLLNAAHETRLKADEKGKFMLLSGYLFAMRNFHMKIPADILDDAFISQLVYKKGYKIKYSPNSRVFIRNPSTFSDWLKQKRRNTGSDAKIREYLGKIQTSRSFSGELSQFYKVFSYAKTFRELWYSKQLLFARLLVWWLGFWDTKIAKKDFNRIWVRIESTK
jgi:cellulose synthase/poly-beta-1,6-N-acetylglucosamine synthase-like glycosyltransferase